MKTLIVAGIFAMLLVVGLSGCIGPTATETTTKTYPATDATIMTISNLNGMVDITGWNGATVVITAEKKSSVGKADLANINISVTTSGDYLIVQTKYTGSSMEEPSIDLTVKVPYNVTIESVTSSNGPIHLTRTKGDAVLSTSNGQILVNQVTGFVSAETSNAYVEVKGTTGIAGLHTSNAAISAEVRSLRRDINIDTSNAAVTVYLASTLDATVDAATSNARVSVEGLTLTNVSLMQETHVVGMLGNGSNRVEIRTSNAGIYINNATTDIT